MTASSKHFSKSYRVYVLALLTLTYVLNFLDRQIIGIISPQLKVDLDLSDFQLGILKGLAFALLYSILGVPIARLADQWRRVPVIASAVALWSMFTALCALATNFWHLFLARVGVGIGEAGGVAPAHSLLSDYFPKESRATALSVFSLGIPIGVTLAYLGGGWISTEFSWRVALLVLGLPGIAVAVLVQLTIAEPRRGGMDGLDESKAAEASDSIIDAARELLAIKTYRWAVFALAAASFGSYSVGAWIIDFFVRSHPEYPILSVFFWLGVINGTAYVVGAFLGGVLVDRIAKRHIEVYGWLPAAALIINVPIFLAAIWVSDPVVSLWFWAPSHLLSGMIIGPTLALAQTLSPIRLRAQAAAVLALITNIIALGLGPTAVGLLSGILAPQIGDAVALNWGLSSIVITTLFSALAYLIVSRKIEQDWPLNADRKEAVPGSA